MANYNLTNQPISASFQQLLQKNDNDFLVDGTGSLVETLKVTGSVSSSTYYGDGSNLTGIATGSGGSVDTGSLLTTASVVDATITFTKGDASTFNIEIDNVTSSLETQDVFVNVKNTSGITLAKGTPVHAVSVTGENIDVIAALNGTPSAMPAIGLLNKELTNNSVGQAIISGRIKNIDTSALVAGASVYVGNSPSGELTSTKPIGAGFLIQNIGVAGKINASNGEIIVIGAGRVNDLPNITEGYLWVGDGDGVPEAISTGSFVSSNVAKSNVIVTPQTITDNITIPTNNNALVLGDTTFVGTVTIEGDSELSIFDTPALGELIETASISGQTLTFTKQDTSTFDIQIPVTSFDTGSFLTTSSYEIDSASFDTRIDGNASLTNNNTLNGNQIVSGSLTGVSGIEVGNLSVGAGGTANLGVLGQIILRSGSGIVTDGAFGNSVPFDSSVTFFNGLGMQGTEMSQIGYADFSAQDPLPSNASGGGGRLAVSGSNLYFNNGTTWTKIN